jgi:dienelactone hydrolase
MATPRLATERLHAADGGPLYVDVRTSARSGETRPVVVICHGFKGFKDWGMFPKVAERFALAGVTAVTFNFSGSGVGRSSDVVDEPERWFRQTLSGDLADLETVISFALRGGPTWVGLVGHSRGGGIAILHTARDARVKTLATWAAVAGFQRYTPEELARWRRDGRMDVVNTRTGQVLPMGLESLQDLERNASGTLDVLAAARRVSVPWLIVHGSADESVPAEEAARLARASGSVRTERLTVEGAGHTFGARHPWVGSTPELESVIATTARFFGSALS